MNKKRLFFFAKLIVMAAVLAFVGWKLRNVWNVVRSKPLRLDWRYLALAASAYLAVMITNGLTWRWIAWQMGDRSRTVPLLGAYAFSQLGKYVPGKVLLVVLRTQRAARLGMPRETCLLSTILENAMYTLSAGLVGSLALALVARDHPLYLSLCVVLVVGLLTVFHPRIFYPLLNRILKSAKRAEIADSNVLRKRHLTAAVLMFFPSWFFGGIVLWATVHSMHGIALTSFPRLCGAFALSVCLGMFSLLPGGLGVREGIQALFLAPLLPAGNMLLVAVALPRLMQITLEVILAGLGALLVRQATRSAKVGDFAAPVRPYLSAPPGPAAAEASSR